MTPREYITSLLPTLNGWCTPEKASKFVALIEEAKSSLFVEIGVFAGRSLFAGALAMPPSSLTIGIDPWERSSSTVGTQDEANREWWAKLDHEKIYRECRSTLASLNLTYSCHLLRCNSDHAYPLISRLPPISFLHIDGNHSTELALFDVTYYVPLVQSNGWIAMDDCDWPTTRKAQEHLATMATLVEMVGNCGFFRKH